MMQSVSKFLFSSLLLISAQATVADQVPPVFEGNWKLVKYESASEIEGIQAPSDLKRFEMYLDPEGRVTMRLDCNRANGSWTAKPSDNVTYGQFKFGDVSSTRANCGPSGFDQFLLRQTPSITGYAFIDGLLHLSLKADAGVFTWQRFAGPASVSSFKSVEQGGPRNWEVTAGLSGANLREEPSVQANVLDKYPSGTILDNLGCKFHEEQVWCDVQKLGGGKRGFVAANLLRAAKSPNGYVMYGEEQSALRAGMGEFDAQGEIICSDSSGTPTRCSFQVARDGGGYATVVIMSPSKKERVIYFRMGRAVGANQSEADKLGRFSVKRVADTSFIKIGSETYELPDSIPFGG